MSTRQPAFAGLASSTSSPFPGPPSEPIPPLPIRRKTDPIKTIPLPLLPQHSASASDLLAERNPPVDPRKARRHCANFGFRREPLFFDEPRPVSISTSTSPSLPPTFSEDGGSSSLTSPGPTPPGTFTGSDSDASSFNDLPYDFPQPPPISPVLRRMKSSPLFTLPDSESQPNLKRWGGVPTFAGGELWKSEDAADSLSDLEAELDLDAPFDTSYRGRIDGLTKELESVIQREPLADPGLSPWTTGSGDDAFRLPAASKSSLLLERSWRHCPQRSVPSARNFSKTPQPLPRAHTPEKKDTPGPSQTRLQPHRQISKMRSLKFAEECNASLERLDISMKPKSQKSLFRGRSISMDFGKPRPMSMGGFPGGELSSSYLPGMGGKGRNAPPLDNPRTPAVRERKGSIGLSTPFLHRPVDSTPRPHRRPHLHASMTQPSPGLKSFIDITPEQAQRKSSMVHRDKVKRLLSRASQVFDWKKKKSAV